ncbi:HAMP domain-containing sensor histidine kinase [Vibrio salinus]|uniref:HAMP domain-containing sensor histidine kinase n=1 Tax=Vibrio salinus TaxID=2899784 RepID=UPI001E48F3C3|nr:HAMP domain-containing sensor histidine kinase [Vibrio salinus]MCE0495919.1 HAMP domain-containing histidine kinase [Vibrio salinus]
MHTHLKNMILDDIKAKSSLKLFEDSHKLTNYLTNHEQTQKYDELISYTFDKNKALLHGDTSVLNLDELKSIFQLPRRHMAEFTFHKKKHVLFGIVVPLSDGGYYYASYNILPMLNNTRIIPLMTGAVLFTVLLSILIISLPFSIRNMLRVNKILDVMHEYANGKHQVRVMNNGYNDEFGRLSDETDLLLSRTEKLMEQVRTANSHIAHELKTPLTRVKNRLINTSAIVEGQALDELEEAAKEIDRVLYLFRAIMKLTEVENGLLSLKREPIHSVKLLQDVTEYYDPLIEQHNISLKISVNKNHSFYADYALILQAVANLLDNAIKYAPDSSKIILRINQQLDTTYIQIIDEGPGIPENMLSQVKERFQRIKRSGTKGFGLGLPFVQAVAERHHGTLSLANCTPGLMATITCRNESVT